MAVLESHKERLVTFLQDQGCLEISGSEEGWGNGNPSEVSDGEIKDKLEKIRFIINTLGARSRAGDMKGKGPVLTGVFDLDKVYSSLRQIMEEEAKLNESLEKFNQERSSLRQFEFCPFRLSVLRGLAGFKSVLASVRRKETGHFRERASRLPFCWMEEARREKGRILFWLVLETHVSVEDLGGEALALPALEGTVRERLEEIEMEERAVNQILRDLQQEKKIYTKHAGALFSLYFYYVNRLVREEAKKKFFYTSETVIVTGWVDAARAEAFSEELRKRFSPIHVSKIGRAHV